MTRTTIPAIAVAVMLTIAAAASAAPAPQPTDLTEKFRAAGAAVERLEVYELAGIVLIRGRAADPEAAAELGRFAQTLGYHRVANLIQIIEHRDAEIARAAEVELSVHRALDGCQFRVRSENGVVHVAGRVRHELQKDVAGQVLRSLDGVRGVQLDLERF